MRLFGFFIVTVSFLGITLPIAHASPCDKATSTYEAATCFDEEYRTTDKRLNVVYKNQRANLDEKGKTLFRDAQRAWIKFRDAECLNAADSSRGGTDSAIVGLRCQTILTERRIKDLEGALLRQIQGRK